MRGCATPYGAIAHSRRQPPFRWRKSTRFFLSRAVRRPQTRIVFTSPGRKLGDDANFFEGFDPGSERTLAAWIRHASRTKTHLVAIPSGGRGERGSNA